MTAGAEGPDIDFGIRRLLLRFALIFLAVFGVVGLTIYPSSRYRATRTTGQRQLALRVIVPLASVVLVFIFAEALVRLLASPTLAGPTVLNTLLLPRSWNDVRAPTAIC
jgi:TRAP-type C4-dicarboxylate transport system permease small subunit